MSGTKTPGKLYFLWQELGTLRWQVTAVDEIQGRSMRERGAGHVYDTAAQAYAVQKRLNLGREERGQLVLFEKPTSRGTTGTTLSTPLLILVATTALLPFVVMACETAWRMR